MRKLREGIGMFYAPEPRLAEQPSIAPKLFIGKENGTYRVEYHDNALVNKVIKCPIMFSDEFTEEEILCSDLVEQWLVKALGYRKVVKWELDV